MATSFQVELEQQAERLLAALLDEQGEHLVSFVLFGSVARGEAVPGSDLDVLIVLDAVPGARHERFALFARALDRMRREHGPLLAAGQPFDWSPILLSMAEARHHSPLYLDMTLEARILHDRAGFFGRVLDGLRERMRALGSRRVTLSDGSWYWDLKPGYRFGEIIEL